MPVERGHGWYDPGTGDRVLTLIRFQALMVTIEAEQGSDLVLGEPAAAAAYTAERDVVDGHERSPTSARRSAARSFSVKKGVSRQALSA